MGRWLSPVGVVLQWLAIAGALAYALALYLANLLAWPTNVSVRGWWGSELAIRYCEGFVRRGVLGQLAWLLSGWLGRQSTYTLTLSCVTAVAALVVGLWLGGQLVRRCGWSLGLLILAAPAGWPVLMVHAGSLFRKDPLQILLGLLLLWLWRFGVNGRSPLAAPAPWIALASLEVVAVLNHEPFALLVLPTLAVAVLWERRDWRRALLAISPGLLAFLLAIWQKGNASQVACLREDLQRLGLLGAGETPGSSITELALSRPSFFTWDLSPVQMGWSVFHAMAMSLLAVLAYSVLFNRARPSQPRSAALSDACRLWGLQLCVAAPLFLATVDYGRWIAMMFCGGLGLLVTQGPSLVNPPLTAHPAATTPFLTPPKGREPSLQRGGLAALELVLLPSHCCTYEPGQILAFVPYAAASQWKALVLHGLALMSSSLS
ncbi:MAG: hypothetical protein VKP70_01635 [Cyanobacteriota bacterium]|nr:hypothetical protein [Cyanobacteriota bacterium]